MTEIVNAMGSNPPVNLPDHSIILGTFNTSVFNILKAEKIQDTVRPELFTHSQQIKAKRNLRKIDNNFFMSNEVKEQVEATILKLENSVRNQLHLDQIWTCKKNYF